jgi:hypothetical protein
MSGLDENIEVLVHLIVNSRLALLGSIVNRIRWGAGSFSEDVCECLAWVVVGFAAATGAFGALLNKPDT